MRAPYPATAARLTALAVRGITTLAGMLRRRAARARAAAWLPEEWVATPRLASSSLSESTALAAPRNLNAPTRWKFSHLKNSAAPVIASRLAQVSTGVRWAYGRIRSVAALTSAIVGRPSLKSPLLRAPVYCHRQAHGPTNANQQVPGGGMASERNLFSADKPRVNAVAPAGGVREGNRTMDHASEEVPEGG